MTHAAPEVDRLTPGAANYSRAVIIIPAFANYKEGYLKGASFLFFPFDRRFKTDTTLTRFAPS